MSAYKVVHKNMVYRTVAIVRMIFSEKFKENDMNEDFRDKYIEYITSNLDYCSYRIASEFIRCTDEEKTAIIPKEEIKLNIGRSPDIADALALTYIQEIIPIGLIEAEREYQNRCML